MEEKLLHYGPTKEAWFRKYDTVAGITQLIDTLEGFYELIQERRKASIDKEYPLTDMKTFIILGKWYINEQGNTGKVEYHVSRMMMYSVPKVALLEDFYAWALAQGVDLTKTSKGKLNTYVRGVIEKFAPPGCVCEECRRPWTMDNAEDVEVDTRYIDVEGEGYVGKTLEEVEAYLHTLPGGYHTIGNHSSLRNDRYIDLTPEPATNSVRNFKGDFHFRKDGPRHDDMSYVMEAGDVLQVQVQKFRHGLCSLYRSIRKEEAFFRRLLVEAGVEIETITAIPNDYDAKYVNPKKPWFLVNGVVKVGYCYRRWEINWSITGKDFTELFKDEDVEKGPIFVRTKGEYEEATEKFKRYVRTVFDAFKVLEEN